MKILEKEEIEAVSGGRFAWLTEFVAVYDAAQDFVAGFNEGYDNSSAHKI